MSKKTLGPIPYGTQNIVQQDIESVTEVLQADYLTQGPKVAEFEKHFADYVGVNYCTAVSNGTAALHLGVIALGIEPGQKVITSPITFAASANCIMYAGGQVDFVDIDPESYLIDLDLLEKKLTNADPGEYAGVIPVDFTGLAVDTERLRGIADKFNLWILEDACHAPGGSFRNNHGESVNCGDCTYADAAIFSFHPVKHIAAGEGGMITTNDKQLKEHLDVLRTHGITKDPDQLEENHGGWYYEMHELGYNYRLTDIQSALGISQLKRADAGLKKRREIARRYYQAFKEVPSLSYQELTQEEKYQQHAYHLYVIEVNNRKEVYDYLRDNEIYAQIHYIPVHLQPYYRQFGWKKGDFPKAETYYSCCISLPMFPTLSKEQQDFVIEKVIEVVE